jgi:soluble lytic murein transglycosylase-like protein
MSGLSTSDYSELASLDLRTRDVSPALDLGPGAPYCLSIIFDKLKQPDVSRRLLELAWIRSADPWKTEAGMALGRAYVSEKSLEAAIKTARELISLTKGKPAEAQARRILVEALYWSQDDKAALAESELLPPGDAEVALFRAVGSLRLGKENVRGLFFDLFLRQRTSSIHARAYLYLSSDTAWWDMFSDLEKELFAAKYAFQQEDWTKGIPAMEGVAARLSPSQIAGTPILIELGAAYLSAGMAARGAAFMEKLGRSLTGEALLDALEAGGKCARKIPDYSKALARFSSLAAGTADRGRQDKARWYILDALIAMRPADLMDRISKESALWNDPSYFADLLEELISREVADRKWQNLIALDSALGQRCPAGIKARLSYILARALAGRIVKRVPGNPDKRPQDLFGEARDADPRGYYGTLSSCILGEIPACVTMGTGAAGSAEAPPADPLVDGYLSFGLTDEAYELIRGRRGAMGEAAVSFYARAMDGAGDTRSAMNLMAFLAGRRMLSAEEMRILYPRAFASLIEALSSSSNLPAAFLYGMIREESFFDPDIVSSAGAIGLAQLMPSTAADVSKRLRMAEPDLTDPQVNLTLGGAHLLGLLDRVGSLPTALLAYNAGLSRFRSWDRQSGGLGLDLFVESVPYEESRQYVRKIMVSTVVYAFLYSGGEPKETIGLFYPDIFPSGAAARQSGVRTPY